MAEFRALPWGEQALLREGLLAEFGIEAVEQRAAEVAQEYGVPEFDVEHQDARPGDLGSLAEMGLTVREV